MALEDASLSTWIHPTDGTGYIYYPKGSLAGFMLDILIRDASDNRRSLDDVMREVYRTTYKRGPGLRRDGVVGGGEPGRGREEVRRLQRPLHRRPRAVPLGQRAAARRAPAPVTDSVRVPRLGINTSNDSTGTASPR